MAQRQFEVQDRAHRPRQSLDIVVLDMATILPQMGGDSIRARGLGEDRRLDRIRFIGATRLPHGRDVIDVDVQSYSVHCPAPSLRVS